MMRSLHDAIMVGLGAACEDDPLLTVRLPGVAQKPLRVVLDSRLATAARARASSRPRANSRPWSSRRPPRRPTREAALAAKGVETARVAADPAGGVDLGAALRLLGKRGVTRVFSEGGPRVASRLIALGLADEVALFSAVKPLGRPGLPALDAAAHAALVDLAQYRPLEPETYGTDTLRRWERVG